MFALFLQTFLFFPLRELTKIKDYVSRILSGTSRIYNLAWSHLARDISKGWEAERSSHSRFGKSSKGEACHADHACFARETRPLTERFNIVSPPSFIRRARCMPRRATPVWIARSSSRWISTPFLLLHARAVRAGRRRRIAHHPSCVTGSLGVP